MSYTKRNPNGQATKANSAPVTIASDQEALPLSTGASTSARQDTGNTSLASIDTKLDALTTPSDDQMVVGNVASGATDSGEPVKTGGVNMTTPPTLTDGQRGNTQMDTRANTKVTLFANNTSTAITTAATNADGQAGNGTASRLETVSRNSVWNGSTWDRMPGDTTGVSVKVGSITPGTTATSLGKAEDSVHTSGDVGVMMLGVRNDAGTVLSADGDYIPPTTDSTGALRANLTGTLSTNNASTSTLLAAGVFTGTADDCLNYNEIRVSVIASHASATDGLSIQQSSDGTNWDIVDTYTVAATTGKTFSVPRQARYMRIVYTNGGTNQTSFRLQTILNRAGARVSSQRAGDAYSNETDLEQAQSFLMGFNGTTWDRLRSDTTNGLDVDVTRLPALVAGSAAIGTVGLTSSTSATVSTVNDTASSTQLLAANTARRGASFYNTSTADLYLKYGTTATTASGGFTVVISAGGYFELPTPVYNGRIDGIWASDQSGAVSITEW